MLLIHETTPYNYTYLSHVLDFAPKERPGKNVLLSNAKVFKIIREAA